MEKLKANAVGNYLMNDTSSMFKAYVRPHVRTNPKTGQKITVDGYNNSKPSKPHLQAPAMDRREWIGVDLDKTLAPRAGQKVLTWKDPALHCVHCALHCDPASSLPSVAPRQHPQGKSWRQSWTSQLVASDFVKLAQSFFRILIATVKRLLIILSG